MAYSQILDMINSFGSDELAKITSNNPPDEYKINTAIAYSDSLIDAYSYGRCDFNKLDVPLLIKKISSDLAYVILCEYYYSYNELPNAVSRLKQTSFQLLDNIAKGHIAADTSNSSSKIIRITNKIYED